MPGAIVGSASCAGSNVIITSRGPVPVAVKPQVSIHTQFASGAVRLITMPTSTVTTSLPLVSQVVGSLSPGAPGKYAVTPQVVQQGEPSTHNYFVSPFV